MARGGQASTEFIVLFGIFFIFLLVFLSLTLDYFFSLRSQRDFQDAQYAVEALAAEADSVHAQGVGAQKMVKITLPGSTIFSPNVTFIGRPLNSLSGDSNTISIALNGTTLTAQASIPVAGSFPNSSGVHFMKVTSQGNFVSIGPHLVSATPPSVFASASQSDTESTELTFRVEILGEANDSVSVTLASPWNYTNAGLNVSPSAFSSFGFADVPVSLTFNTSANAVGIYTSTLNVTAVRQTEEGAVTARETFSVPLTLEVSSG